jgi:anti-sigma regulatory factor (Ser/Thr protein kinase)
VSIDVFKRLTPDPASVPEARAALSPLEERVDPATFETIGVLVSELVTNSVVHGGTGAQGSADIELSVSATRERIHVEVTDAGPVFSPTARDDHLEREAVWGFQLVEAFSDHWGMKSNGRTTVWFELEDSGAFAHRARRVFGIG